MRGILVSILIGLTAVLAHPAIEINNDLIDEWVVVPDANWNMHLVNINGLEIKKSFSSRKAFVVEFILVTRENTNGEVIPAGDLAALKKSQFNPKNPTRIISHGWKASRNTRENILIATAYLTRGEYNVIVIDWSSGANTEYVEASSNTMEAGKQVAAFIDFLSDNAGLKFDTLYLIGHSLGSHVVGIAGKHVTRGKVNTIFGLDVAEPLFSIANPGNRLAKGDALYVESIHTNAGQLGFSEPIGDASFYPNWGKGQPGCTDTSGSCDHARCYIYFAESLANNDEFDALQCKDFNAIINRSCDSTGRSAKMGGEPSNYGRGVKGEYYLPTNSKNPYGVGSKWMK